MILLGRTATSVDARHDDRHRAHGSRPVRLRPRNFPSYVRPTPNDQGRLTAGGRPGSVDHRLGIHAYSSWSGPGSVVRDGHECGRRARADRRRHADPRSHADGVLATVFVDRTRGLAGDLRIDHDALLGRTIAHELGHLLLATTAHAKVGLMREAWSREELAVGSPRCRRREGARRL